MRHPLDAVRPTNNRDVRRRETPQDRPGKESCPNKYILEILGNPNGGTISLKLMGAYRGIDLSLSEFDVDYDATAEEIKTAAETSNGYDPEADPVEGFPVTVEGGPLPNNDIVIVLPSGVWIQRQPDALLPEAASGALMARYSKIRRCC